MMDFEYLHKEEEKEEKERRFDSFLNFSLMEKRTIFISEPVTPKLTKRVLSQLMLMDMEDSSKEIRIFLNSPGGSADDGFAIYDAIRSVKSPVKIICTGLTASAGTIILCAASKENRLSFPHTRIMMHQPSSGVMGTASDIRISAEQIVKLRDRANRVISEATGQPKEKIEADTNRDFWLEAQDAVEYGLIGRLVQSF
ncbi:MAG: ATP-dependent Clp protease proteolytic subunit, partial [Planctomycetota bacterium]